MTSFNPNCSTGTCPGCDECEQAPITVSELAALRAELGYFKRVFNQQTKYGEHLERERDRYRAALERIADMGGYGNALAVAEDTLTGGRDE